MRLGLKFVVGLREVVGQRLVAAREERAFDSLADLHARVEPNQAEIATLAEIGALAALGGERREAMWQVEALGRSGKLFARAGGPRAKTSSPLPRMTESDEMVAEMRGTSLTTGPHPISFLRPVLEREGILGAAALARQSDGRRVRVGGLVVVRQRPGTARGFVFITLEDETGFSNAIVTPDMFERWRPVILRHPGLVIEGRVQNRDGVVLLKADRFAPLPGRVKVEDISRDFR